MTNEIKIRKPITCYFDETKTVLLVEVKNSLSTEDFTILSQVIDPYYKQHKEFNGIIINSKKFPYWKGTESLRAHISFVQNHHYKTKKVAICMGGFFPKLLPKLARRFVQPEVKNFGYNKIDAANHWILS